MKQLRNNRSKANHLVVAPAAAARMVSKSGAPLDGTLPHSAAPIVSNGCISELSADDIHGRAHDYAVAMKTYAAVYENFQAYLEPANILATHDYELSTRPVPECEHLGCLNQEFIESTTHADMVSDEEIESCGYLGYLRH